MRTAVLALVVLIVGIMVLLARGTSPQVNETAAVEPAPTTSFAQGEDATAVVVEELEISDDAVAHYEAALDYLSAGRPGLAQAEARQAVAAAPVWKEAASLLNRANNAVARELAEQEAAIAAVARADATAAAQVQIDARSTVTTREAQQAAAAAAQAERQNQARIATYARTPPRGHWGERAGNVWVSVGGFSYDTEAGRFSRAARGTRYIAFGIVVENNTSRSIHVNPGNVTMVDQKGATYRYDSATFSWCNRPLQAVDVQPGNHVDGCLLFQVDSSTGPAKIIYRVNSFSGPEITINLERPADGGA